MSICHCTDCQVLTGSPFRASVSALPNSFRMLAGSPRIYTTSPGPEPRQYNIRMGSIAGRARLTPRVQSWCRSELPWLAQVAGVPRLDQGLSSPSTRKP